MYNLKYTQLARKMFGNKVIVTKLGAFCDMYECVIVRNVKVKYNRGDTKRMRVRVLSTGMYDDRNYRIQVLEREVSVNAVNIHSLDDKCVVIPDITDYKGAYRFIPTKDVPTLIGTRSSYIRCPSVEIALGLALWLQSGTVVAVIREEFKRLDDLKEMNKQFLEDIVVPGESLNKIVLDKALKLEEKIYNTHLELNEMIQELESFNDDSYLN